MLHRGYHGSYAGVRRRTITNSTQRILLILVSDLSLSFFRYTGVPCVGAYALISIPLVRVKTMLSTRPPQNASSKSVISCKFLYPKDEPFKLPHADSTHGDIRDVLFITDKLSVGHHNLAVCHPLPMALGHVLKNASGLFLGKARYSGDKKLVF